MVEDLLGYRIAQLKFVKKSLFGKCFYAKAIDLNESLRNAEKDEKAKGLFKKGQVNVALEPRGFQGNYIDTPNAILRKLSPEMLEGVKAYSVKIKQKTYTIGAEAEVSLYSAPKSWYEPDRQ